MDMAAASPALSNTSTDTATTTTTIPNPTTATPTASASAAAITSNNATVASATSQERSNPPKTLRGLNKPKCIRCGNVARSRCPYQSCKSCCSKAENPCHIHVLKANATFPDKTATSTSTMFEQNSTEVSPSGTSHRATSLRQLSNNFAQFNNVQIPLRSKKPLTRKEAAAINEWRFSRLKEYKDRNIETENESFDRYMQNINLLEEVFSINSTLEGSTENGFPVSNNDPTLEDNSKLLISGVKLKLRSNPTRTYNFKKRLQEVVDNGLRKFQKRELNDASKDIYDDQNELVGNSEKLIGWRDVRALALSDLVDKLNKARSEEDLKVCLEVKAQLSNRHPTTSKKETEFVGISEEQTAGKELEPRQDSDFSLPKLFRATEIDQKTLNNIDVHFSTLEQIEDL